MQTNFMSKIKVNTIVFKVNKVKYNYIICKNLENELYSKTLALLDMILELQL